MPTSDDLFPQPREESHAPLANRMRPRTLDEFVGQREIVGEGSLLRRAILEDRLGSVILWGPPGVGKTSLGHIIAQYTGADFVPFSAVTAGIPEIRATIKRAEESRAHTGKRTILFVDEIHRFNKAQQDAFLPHVERGTIILIGATTENPSFRVNAPLLSRARVYVLKPLGRAETEAIIARALADAERGLGGLNLRLQPDALDYLIRRAEGDARVALNALELAANLAKPEGPSGERPVNLAMIEDALQSKALLYDRAGDQHFDLISALHKSIRGGDPDAGLYYLARMLEGGEDPLYIARRLIRVASEDVGLADPKALSLTVAARDAVHFMGLPEGALALAQAVVYLAIAPKSNALYVAYEQAVEDVRQTGSLDAPLSIRNAPTRLMAEIGYGKGYQYAHDLPDAVTGEEYFPEPLVGRVYYQPTDRGLEAKLKQWLANFRQAREQAKQATKGEKGKGPGPGQESS